MRILYHGGGATVTDIRGPLTSEAEWQKVRAGAVRLLKARGHTRAAALLEQMPFEWVDATNYFEDEFSALRIVVPVDKYVAIQETAANKTIEPPFELIAKTITEIAPSRPFVRFVVIQLDTEDSPVTPVPPPSLQVTSASVESALADAELLLRSRGASSAVDRVHTALHGYLRAALERAGESPSQTAPVTELLKRLRENHNGLSSLVAGGDETKRIVMSLGAIVDAANTLRNTASAAHPTARTLDTPEALLVIHSARTLMHYLDAKLSTGE